MPAIIFKSNVDIDFSFILCEEMRKKFFIEFNNYPIVILIDKILYGTERWFKINIWTLERFGIPIVLNYHGNNNSVILSDGCNQLVYWIN